MDEQPFPYDIFISYNNAQRDWALQIARRLRADDFKVWLDEWVLPQNAGINWIDSLAKGVEQSRKVALVWSPEFFSATWPGFEASVIQQMDPIGRQQRVIPLLHTQCAIPQKWGFRQALDFSASPTGTIEFDFHYHHLVYNLDATRPYEGDLELFRAAHKPIPISPTHNSEDRGQPWDKASRKFWADSLRSGFFRTAIFLIGMALTALTVYFVRGTIDETSRRKAEPRLYEANSQLSDLRHDYESLENNPQNRESVNSRARALLNQLLSIDDLNLTQGMQIFKYQHVCYTWGIVAQSESEANGAKRLEAADNMLRACDVVRAALTNLSETQKWITGDNTESRANRLRAVAFCMKWQINRDPADRGQVRNIINNLPADYLAKEHHPENTGELQPCLNPNPAN